MSAGITSIKDERIALARALDTRAGREKHGRCLLEGPALIAQAVAAGAEVDFVLYADDQRGTERTAESTELLDALRSRAIPLLGVRESLLRKAIRSPRPVSWLAVAVLPPGGGPGGEFGDVVVVLDDVLDPGNLGSIVRTACGLGAPDVVCTSPDTDLTGRRVVDASRAAVLRTRTHRFDSPLAAVDALRGKGFHVVATSPRGAELPSVALPPGPLALVVGNETDGVRAEVLDAADLVVRIPMAGALESLNVAVATGIALYALCAARHGRSATTES